MYGFFEPVPQPGPDPRPQNPAGTDQQHHHPPRDRQQPAWNLHLQCADTNVPIRFLTESPSMAVLAVEDLCWQAATEDWRRRRPRWWQPRARTAWNAEGAQLAAKAERLRAMADEVLAEL